MKPSRIYKALQSRANGDAAVVALLANVEQIYEKAVALLKTVPLYMRQYTLHDHVHVDSVIDLMGRLLPDHTFGQLKPLELASLLLAAALHDIGMVASDAEVKALRNEGRPEEARRTEYQAFREAYPGVLRRLEQLRRAGRHTEAVELEDYLTSEYLRQQHGGRCRGFLFSQLRDCLEYAGNNFTSQLAGVCASHTGDPRALDDLPCWELVRQGGERCNWRFVALMLRLADILDFDAKRTPRILLEHLGIRDRVSLSEWGKHLAINAWDIAPGRIAFSARCPDPVVQKAIYDFIAQIDRELLEAPGILARMHHSENPNLNQQYLLDLPARVNTDQVAPEEDENGPRYEFVDLQFTIDRDRIVSLVLGVSLYADRSLFLRELLQNAIDACRHRRAIHQGEPDLGGYEPRVTVRLREERENIVLEVEDNGTGMDRSVFQQYFARIGRSYYASHEFLESRSRLGLDFQPISQFGIGILSSFMAGDVLRVDTLRFGTTARPISAEIADEGALFSFGRGTRATPGTKVTLTLAKPLEELFPAASTRNRKASKLDPLKDATQNLAPHVEFPIAIECEGKGRTIRAKWELPRCSVDNDICRSVTIDLTRNAPKGIDGIAEVLMLADPATGHFCFALHGYRIDEDTEISYYCRKGCIEESRTLFLASGATEDGGSLYEVQPEGRWTQQGILVSCELFEGGFSWARKKSPVTIPFPLPVHYDFDLSRDYVLPLSADRKSILPTEQARPRCKGIARVLARLLLDALGKTEVLQNEAFFREQFGEDDEADLLAVLSEFLGS